MPGDREALIALEVVGVRVELPSNQPIVLLRESEGPRYLPIWIGGSEATAIATALEGVVPPRPLTHDLMRSVIDALGALAVRVVITEMRDSVFYADGRMAAPPIALCEVQGYVYAAKRGAAELAHELGQHADARRWLESG